MNAFDRQVETLVRLGYPSLTGMSTAAFTGHLEPLRASLTSTVMESPFAIVVRGIAHAQMMERVRIDDRAGVVSITGSQPLDAYRPIDGVALPEGPYVVTGLDSGAATMNVTPDAALAQIRAEARSPLTIEEGLAFVTQHPTALKKGHGFSLCGVRAGDKRVTALWIAKEGPKLGWCWAGNPHTWLGSGSCSGRVGA